MTDLGVEDRTFRLEKLSEMHSLKLSVTLIIMLNTALYVVLPSAGTEWLNRVLRTVVKSYSRNQYWSIRFRSLVYS